ncbi:hypothetical protein K438DRAFT_1814335 [Mycena galopus ATCC 62051]|nr:hypothetical protein K438DRAFT_1814335 [Mycena galopus ATCC 62051]
MSRKILALSIEVLSLDASGSLAFEPQAVCHMPSSGVASRRPANSEFAIERPDRLVANSARSNTILWTQPVWPLFIAPDGRMKSWLAQIGRPQGDSRQEPPVGPLVPP